MSRLARLEDRIKALEDVLANMTFVSDAPSIVVQVPVPVLDSNGDATGVVTTGSLQIKTGPSEGKVRLKKNGAELRVR